jgi:putative inorganic carbon (HCO3(-)) transporter
MSAALRAADRRTVAVLGCGLLAAAASGLLAGRWPVVALGLALAAALAVAMLSNLALGIALFTVGAFAQVLHFGGAATGAKALGGLLVLAWVATLARRSPAERRTLLRDQRWLLVLVVGLVAWSILSAAWAQSRSTALVGASRYAQDLVLFPILYLGVRRLSDVRLVAAAFVAGALGSSLYGVLAGSTVDGSRLVGALGDPNETAAVLAAAAVLAFCLGMGERRSAVRRGIAFAAAALALLALVATASRGGLVALAATAIVGVVVAGRWRRQMTTAVAACAVLVACWFFLFAPASSRSHITNTQSGRTTLWTVAGRAISANPVVGLGDDNFQVAAKQFLLQPGQTTAADQIVTVSQPAHNVYLEIWADLGIVGLALFAGIVVLSLRAGMAAAATLARDGRVTEEILARGLVVATAAMLAASFFLSDQYNKQMYLLLALSIAMLTAARSAGGRDDTPAFSRLRVRRPRHASVS